MPSAALQSAARRPAARTVQELGELADILDPAVNLCVMPRELPAGLQRFSRAAMTAAAAVRTSVRPSGQDWATLPASLRALPGFRAFCADLDLLVELLDLLLEPDAIGLRLQRLEGPMCPRLHVDRVGIRLLCTYLGPGTEYLDDCHDSRDLLDQGGPRPLAAREALASVPTGAIALLKGDAFPGNEGGGVIHRSPHDPAPRLLLSLDALWS